MTTPIHSDWTPRKPDIYRLYQIWKALPRSIKTAASEEQIENLNQTYQNEDILKLIGIRTQQQFAQTFEVHEDTLSDWNRNTVPEEYKVDWRIWVREHTKEIWDSFVSKAIERGDPLSLKTYMQIAEGYEEKTTTKHEGLEDLFTSVKAIAERNQQ